MSFIRNLFLRSPVTKPSSFTRPFAANMSTDTNTYKLNREFTTDPRSNRFPLRLFVR